jgi:histidinol-phosphate aminotransferase
VAEWLAEIDFVKKIYPSDANFLLIEVDDADKLYNQLAAQKIITRNRNAEIKNCIRITIGTPEQNECLLTAMKVIAQSSIDNSVKSVL